MKIAVIADIHSNLYALEEVLREIKRVKIFCCGDLVGYNPFPNEVVGLIKKENIISILGNHDHAVLTGDTSWFNPIAAKAIQWTREELKEENKKFLKRLPTMHEHESFSMIHGSPKNPLEEYVYPDHPDYVFKDFFNYTRKDVIILGHTHVPFVRRIDNKLVFNPGGVGQPRDMDPRASYAMFDTKTKEVEIKRVEYDVEKVAKEILKKGLPGQLAFRLFQGF
jgi:putative phosphoesterase